MFSTEFVNHHTLRLLETLDPKPVTKHERPPSCLRVLAYALMCPYVPLCVLICVQSRRRGRRASLYVCLHVPFNFFIMCPFICAYMCAYMYAEPPPRPASGKDKDVLRGFGKAHILKSTLSSAFP